MRRKLVMAALCAGLVGCADADELGEGPDAGEVSAGPEGDAQVGPGENVPDEALLRLCEDDGYREALPSREVALDDLIEGYQSAGFFEFTMDVLARRYPLGAFLVEEGSKAEYAGLPDCVSPFARRRDTAADIFDSLGTVVHECGHIYDGEMSGYSTDFYQVSSEVSFNCKEGDAVGRGGRTFARSRINNDLFGAANPDDMYQEIYLDGDPDDNRFDSGDQGFNMLLEEANQYVNSLAVHWTYRDQYPDNIRVTSRDGILTFLWYIERYLNYARAEYPEAYAYLVNDACWREAILTIWGRAWLYLDLTSDDTTYGIRDTAIEALVFEPELIGEIDRVREIHGCPEGL